MKVSYDRKKSPNFYYRLLPVHFLPVDLIIETVPGTLYLMRQIHATWQSYKQRPDIDIVPRIEIINAIDDCIKQNVPFDLEHIATPGPIQTDAWTAHYQRPILMPPVKRAIRLNDFYLFRQSMQLKISLQTPWVEPIDIKIMIIGYQIEE